MTTDYEKEYKEASKRFNAWREKYLTGGTALGDVIFDKTGEMQAEFNAIFPKLAESDDEVIIIKMLGVLRLMKEEGKEFFGSEPIEKCINWLEKQKESLHIQETCKGNPDSLTNEQKEQKPSEPSKYDERIKMKIINHLEMIKMGCVICAIDTSEEIAWLERQKSSDLPAGFYYIDQDGRKYYSKEFSYNNGTFKTTMKVVEKQKPVNDSASTMIPSCWSEEQKPVWSEKDEAMRDNILRVLSCFVANVECDSNPSLSTSYPEFQREMDWLKSLPLNLKKKNEDVAKLCSNEWSEEDKQVVDEIIGSLCDFRNLIIDSDSHWVSNPKLKDISREIVWLKSLRNRPKSSDNWKPSEELIVCLERLIAFKNPEPEDIKGCESLLEQLRKL